MLTNSHSRYAQVFSQGCRCVRSARFKRVHQSVFCAITHRKLIAH
ncbi:hypothetical protein PSE_4322 [Pseudovibrio sp. FO-BEG1]|nr:hypothetical protein PSE_4322 [Pseudovibrio sp. FO-BEG1]